MKMLPFEEFLDDFGNAAKQTMNLSIYRDSFNCSCGKSHWFDEFADIVCQGWGMKLMVVCPDDPSFLTSIKIKTFMVFKFKGFESLCGTRLANDLDKQAFQMAKLAFQGG